MENIITPEQAKENIAKFKLAQAEAKLKQAITYYEPLKEEIHRVSTIINEKTLQGKDYFNVEVAKESGPKLRKYFEQYCSFKCKFMGCLHESAFFPRNNYPKYFLIFDFRDVTPDPADDSYPHPDDDSYPNRSVSNVF